MNTLDMLIQENALLTKLIHIQQENTKLRMDALEERIKQMEAKAQATEPVFVPEEKANEPTESPVEAEKPEEVKEPTETPEAEKPDVEPKEIPEVVEVKRTGCWC